MPAVGGARESLNRLLRRLQNVDQTLMGAVLKLLTAVLILMNSAQDGHHFLVGGQGNGARHASAGALSGLHDSLCSGIHQLVVIAL